MNRQAAASRGASADRDMAMRLGIIDRRTDLARQTGGDIPYGGAQLGALGGRVGADTGYAGSWGTMNQGPSKAGQILGGVGKVAAVAAPVIIAL